MKIKLHGKYGITFEIDYLDYSKILELAERFGWHRMGTMPPQTKFYIGWDKSELCWDKNYIRQEGQLVFKEDALSIASSLRKALFAYRFNLIRYDAYTVEYIPLSNISRLPKKQIQRILEESTEFFPTKEGLIVRGAMRVENYFLPSDTRLIKRFILFCRLGGFRIAGDYE